MALRILHLDSGREWRGQQRQVLLLARGLRERGYEPLIVGMPESPLVQRSRARGVAVSAVKTRGGWDLRAVQRLRALLRTWRPDLVHAHDGRSHALALLALIGRRRVPLVVTRRVVTPPRNFLARHGRRAQFIAISRAVQGGLVAARIPPDRISVVYSGVPEPQVARPRDWRAEVRWPAESVLCGVVGSVAEREQGTEMLSEIARRLPPEARAATRLLILGGRGGGACEIGGVEAFRAGFVDEMHAAIAGLDLVWHPAPAEGLGTALLDAMALRVPPIAFAVGGVPELIEDGRSGVLVAPGDVDAFARVASSLIASPSAREALGAGGPARAREFGVQRMVAGTEAVYQKALAPVAR